MLNVGDRVRVIVECGYVETCNLCPPINHNGIIVEINDFGVRLDNWIRSVDVSTLELFTRPKVVPLPLPG